LQSSYELWKIKVHPWSLSLSPPASLGAGRAEGFSPRRPGHLQTLVLTPARSLHISALIPWISSALHHITPSSCFLPAQPCSLFAFLPRSVERISFSSLLCVCVSVCVCVCVCVCIYKLSLCVVFVFSVKHTLKTWYMSFLSLTAAAGVFLQHPHCYIILWFT